MIQKQKKKRLHGLLTVIQLVAKKCFPLLFLFVFSSFFFKNLNCFIILILDSLQPMACICEIRHWC